MELVFEKRSAGAGRSIVPAPPGADAVEARVPAALRRAAPAEFPELSEIDIVRHYLALSRRQVGVDSTFYPLGSCTMKYNPKVCEEVARLEGFASLHPHAPGGGAQGMLAVLRNLELLLNEISGMDAFSLAPMAGAQGEWVGLLIVRAFHRARGDERKEVLVPDSVHGTNPASAALAGFRVRSVASGPDGEVDLAALRQAVGPQTAALMLTNPNTLGLFETRIKDIAALLHDAGALLYYDGANLNAICGVARPGDMGFDIVHLNLHKTFGTPHGGGGPGAGPVGVKAHLAPYLPVPRVVQRGEALALSEDLPESIGRVGAFAGNVGVLLRAYVYARCLGREGIARVGRHAVLAARYLARLLEPHFAQAYDRPCMHEFVARPSAAILNTGVKTLHVAKRLIDMGFHPPTVYFPLIVPEALMVEPTETEPKERLDAFAAAMHAIAREALSTPERVTAAPSQAPVGRVDEVKAARELVLTYDMARERDAPRGSV